MMPRNADFFYAKTDARPLSNMKHYTAISKI